MELCWRYGGVFKSHATVREDGRVVRLFNFIIRYDEVDAPEQDDGQDRLSSLRMTGPLENESVWKALQYVASAVVILSEEWPGVLWKGWSQCPEHPRTGVMYLAPPHEAGMMLFTMGMVSQYTIHSPFLPVNGMSQPAFN